MHLSGFGSFKSSIRLRKKKQNPGKCQSGSFVILGH